MFSALSSHPHFRELTIDEHLRLVAVDIKCAPESLRWAREDTVVQFMGGDFAEPTLEGERKRLQEILADTDAVSWMIELNGAVIGNITLSEIANTTATCGRPAALVAIIIGDKEHWGKGIGKRVTQAVAAWAFAEGGFEELRARILPINTASLALFASAGFKKIGTEPVEDGAHQGSEWMIVEKVKSE